MQTRGRKRTSEVSDENSLSERRASASDPVVKKPRRSTATYSSIQQPRATRSLRNSTKTPTELEKKPTRRRSRELAERSIAQPREQQQVQEEEKKKDKKKEGEQQEEEKNVNEPKPATTRKRKNGVDEPLKRTPTPIVASDRVTRRQAKAMEDDPFSMIPKMPDGTPIEVPMNRELQSLLAAAEQEIRRAPRPVEPKLDLSTLNQPVPRKRNKEPSTPRQITLTVKETPPPSPPPPKRQREEQASEANAQQQLYYKTFGFKLAEEEANIVRGTPSDKDRQMFARAKEIASIKESDNHRPIEASENGVPPKIPRIEQIQFGDHLIDTWFAAPYPEEYSRCRTLYICEYCLKYMNSAFVAQRHKLKCVVRHPPGDEIYRDGQISIFEVDGRKNKMYCQNLCLLAKMFLDHKTLYYDVEPFLFYILTEVDDRGCHFVGYFSKEKRSSKDYNVSCILTLPVRQRKGYGQYLIDFSYLLTREEQKTGSPEKPLSDLGLISYRSYWKTKVFEKLKERQCAAVSIDELSLQTGMTVDDVVLTLQAFDMLKKNDQDKYYIEVNKKMVDTHLQKVQERREERCLPTINPRKLTWTPFVLSRDRLAGIAGDPSLAAE